VRIEITDSKRQLALNITKIHRAEENHRKLHKAFEKLASDTNLLGQGYASLRNRVTTFDQPLSKGFVSYTVSMSCLYGAQKSYINKYYLPSETFRDSVAIQSNLDDLYSQLRSAEARLAIARNDTAAIIQLIARLEALIAELEDKLEKMRKYEVATSKMYDSANRLAETLKRGVRYSGSLTWQNGWQAQLGASDQTWQNDLEENAKEAWWKVVGIAREFIYGDEDNLYGGNQASPGSYFNTSTKREDILAKIFEKYDAFSSMTDAQQLEFLREVNLTGCSYTALANVVMEQYYFRPEDFRKDFGFSLFRTENDKQILNMEPLIADIYCARVQHEIDSGNQTKIVYDGFFTGGNDFFTDYIADKTEKQKVTASLTIFDPSVDYGEKLKDGNVIISATPPSTYSRVGRNSAQSLRITIDTTTTPPEVSASGHATVLTGTTTSNGQTTYTVSSWGNKYTVDSIGANDYALVDTVTGRVDYFSGGVPAATADQVVKDVRTRMTIVNWSTP
jgi:hypothetical protein